MHQSTAMGSLILGIIVAAGGLVVGMVVLSIIMRPLKQLSKNTDDIKKIQQTYVTRSELHEEIQKVSSIQHETNQKLDEFQKENNEKHGELQKGITEVLVQIAEMRGRNYDSKSDR